MDENRANSALLLRVPGAVCAFPIREVIETMRPLPIEPLANLPEFVLGVALIRGSVVPVIDLKAVFEAHASEPPMRFVTIRVGERCVALAVQSVVGVVDLGKYTLEEMPPLLKSARPDVIQAIGVLDSELLMVLRTSRLVQESAWKAIDKCEAAALSK